MQIKLTNYCLFVVTTLLSQWTGFFFVLAIYTKSILSTAIETFLIPLITLK